MNTEGKSQGYSSLQTRASVAGVVCELPSSHRVELYRPTSESRMVLLRIAKSRTRSRRLEQPNTRSYS